MAATSILLLSLLLIICFFLKKCQVKEEIPCLNSSPSSSSSSHKRLASHPTESLASRLSPVAYYLPLFIFISIRVSHLQHHRTLCPPPAACFPSRVAYCLRLHLHVSISDPTPTNPLPVTNQATAFLAW